MEKKPFSIAITRNETGETETFEANAIMAGISVDAGTQMICMVKNASPYDMAGALYALRGLVKIHLQEHPELVGLLDYIEAVQKSDAEDLSDLA